MATTCVQSSKEINKRQIVGGVMGGANKAAAVLNGTSAEDLASLLDKMKVQLDAKLDSLQEDCANEKNKLKVVYKAAMMKINKNIKGMRIAEFNALYKCDLLSIIEGLPEQAAGKKRDRFETPSHQSTATGRLAITTPSRTVRRGEVLYSKNGSPVEAADEGALIATVTKAKKRRTGSTGDTAEGASLDLNLGDGQFISLHDPRNVGTLDNEKKNMALQQLQMLRSQVDSVLKHLQN